MIKRILLLLMFVSTISCGYETILSKKNGSNYNFSVEEMVFEGNRIINLKVKEKLSIYRLNKKAKNFTLKIKSANSKVVIGKNLKGDPTNFKNIANLYVTVLLENNVRNILKFETSFNYYNSKNKFDLKNYEKNIKKNSAEKMANELIVKLSNIQ